MTLPVPELYLASIDVIPWKRTLKAAVNAIVSEAGDGWSILDLMCGPGQLLGMIQAKRPDLRLFGLDSDSRYTSFARKHVNEATFITQDVLQFISANSPSVKNHDVITMTAGLHHLNYESQKIVISNICNVLRPRGVMIVAEICIGGGPSCRREFYTEVMKYHWAAIQETLVKTRDPILLAEAVDVLRADLVGEEYKLSRSSMKALLETSFETVITKRVWPDKPFSRSEETGEFLFICRSD